MSYRYILMGKFNNKIEKHLELSEIADILKEYREYYKKSKPYYCQELCKRL